MIGTLGTVQLSRDVIFNDLCGYDPEIDNSPSNEAFAALIEDITEYPTGLTHLEAISFFPTPDLVSPVSSYPVSRTRRIFSIILAGSEKCEWKIDEFRNKIHRRRVCCICSHYCKVQLPESVPGRVT